MKVYCVMSGEVREDLDNVAYASNSKKEAEEYAKANGFLNYFGNPQIEILDVDLEQKEHKCCKDCKWWKDSDGVYRRGLHKQCPINRKEVFDGEGYCYMFEPKMEGRND